MQQVPWGYTVARFTSYKLHAINSDRKINGRPNPIMEPDEINYVSTFFTCLFDMATHVLATADPQVLFMHKIVHHERI